MLQIFPLYPDTILPKKANPTDAGWDCSAHEYKVLKPGERHRFHLGFAIVGEADRVYKIEGRSGLAFKHGINTIGNVIDSSYQGEVHAILINHGAKPLTINRGDRICQLLIHLIDSSNHLHVAKRLPTIYEGRGVKGFGSTGL